MSSEFPSWLRSQQARVDTLLSARMAELSKRAPPALSTAMQYSLLDGGKRLRPVLCLAFADAVSGTLNGGGTVADDAACALECIHTYSLVHDDLPAMDNDDLRRGRPTSHKAFGEAMAILVGDALLTDAFTMLATGPEKEHAIRGRMVAELARASGAGGMVGGQVLDIAEDRPAELDYLLRLHRHKTGALITAACRLGAIAGGGDSAAVEAAQVFGDSIGLAFQIADDLLDVTASAETMGKPTGADAAAGRHTFPAVAGFEQSKTMAWEYVKRAQHAVNAIEGSNGPLAWLAAYTVERSS